tara:strand:- start:207 stop:671 length:465 start_codon:yes stop_codon:yes gene_type:complete
MKTFTDNAGREWSITITIATVKKIRGSLDIDLAADDLSVVLQDLGTDPVKLCDLIFVLCSDQAEKAGISDVQFGESLAGDAIDSATSAFMDELVDFTPKKKRTILRNVLDKLEVAKDLAVEKALDYLDSQEFEQEISNAIKFGKTSTESPVSSE